MSVLSSLFNLVKRIISKVFSFVKKLFKRLWPILLIVALIYFAPAIGPFLTSAGLPSLGSFFSTMGTTMTPSLVKFLSSVWSGVGSLGSSAWNAFSSLSFGTQLSVATGAAALLAPEETADLIGEVVDTVGDIAGDVLSATGMTPWLIGGGLLLLFLFLKRGKS